MNRFIKLLNMELGRTGKMYLSLLGLTFFLQLVGVLTSSKGYMNNAKRSIYEEGLSKAEYINNYGKMSFSNITDTLWYMGPIALCAAALIFYCFLIWYRDWYGKNTFIYRLLMLPTSRMNMYIAKASAIFLMVLGLIAFQLILFPIQDWIFKGLVPDEFRYPTEIRSVLVGNQIFQLIIPTTFSQFLCSYGLGFMAVLILFTAILCERSYRLKGVAFGVMYCIASVVIFLSPVLVMEIFHLENLLYPMEFFFIHLFLGLLVSAISLLVSNYLINKKITV